MLVNCSECRKQISDKASFCPNCGAPVGVGGRAVCKSHLKKTVALLFAISMGVLGAHNTYLGYKKKATIELMLCIVGVFTIPIVIGSVVLAILWFWAIIETLSYSTDSDGNILEW